MHSSAYNDQWDYVGDENGRPKWARRGNREEDFIKWDGFKWILIWIPKADPGSTKPGYECLEDELLPPKTGWQAVNGYVGGVPILQYEIASTA